jgi:hypothetical protein
VPAKDGPVKAGKVVQELVGKWRRKPAGGRFAEYAGYAENLGIFETFEISETGHVTRETLAAAKNYDCRTEDSAKNEGAVIVENDSQLNITLDVGTSEHTDFCSSEKNRIDPTRATSTDYRWKIERDESGATELCLTSNNETACYLRAESGS